MDNINSSEYMRQMQIVRMYKRAGIMSHIPYVRYGGRLEGFALLAD
jgi:hypothetical protein